MHYDVTHLLEVLVTVDVLLIVGVLQLVGLHVLPERLDDAGAGLRVNAQQASQARVQLKLGGLWRPGHHVTGLFTHVQAFGAAPSDMQAAWSLRPSPGSPASAAACSARSRRPAASPGSRPSPGWWACGATETAGRRPAGELEWSVWRFLS